jgi:hypothetical protein
VFESRWQHHFPGPYPLIVQHPRAGIFGAGFGRLLGYPRVTRATKRRVSGATTKIVGKATIQLLYHAAAHNAVKSTDKPAAFSVATPDTTQDIMIDKKKLNNSGANLAGIISLKKSSSWLIATGPYIWVVTLARCGVHSALPSARHHLNLPKPTDQPADLPDQTQQMKHPSPQIP